MSSDLTPFTCGGDALSATEGTTLAPVERLDAISGDDPEHAHGAADAVLLACVPTEVADAYRRVGARCGWWATA